MSTDTKIIALQAAVLVTKDGDAALAAAVKFHKFLAGATPDATDKATPAASGKAATTGKTATGKPATAAGATPEAKAAARLAAKQAADIAAQDAADAEAGGGDEGGGGVTKGEVGAAIKALMNAGMRPAAKALLTEFGAEALSGLVEDDYAAFLDKANDLLTAA